MARTKKSKTDPRALALFDVGPARKPVIEVRPQPSPIWTEHKALLIERYLYYFVLITKHGTYIDAFAGPQEEQDGASRWSAKLVVESQPRWLQKFFLFDAEKQQVARLEQLRDGQPAKKRGEPKRSFVIEHGDCNDLLPTTLAKRPIKDKEAAFALLDQRTFECEWRTVEALARYKPEGQHRIELFYFLPNAWLDRALAATTKDTERLRAWWGRDDWATLRGMKKHDRAARFAERFRELGYASVMPWPIMQKDEGEGSVMYYMIHATDHPEAPKLMDRAYRRVLRPREENIRQLTIDQLLAMDELDADGARSGSGD